MNFYVESVPLSGVDGAESNDISPESHKVFMRTWGCSHNTSDSEYMAGLLVQQGFRITSNVPIVVPQTGLFNDSFNDI